MMASTPLTSDPTVLVGHQNSREYQPMSERNESMVVGAIANHRLLVLMCAAVFAAIGAGFGLSRAGTYTSSTTLQVGQANPNSPGFYGFVQSATDLAAAFSRSITAESVLDAVHRQLGLAPDETVARLSAEPIPNSPIFRVIATGPTARSAISLANVASGAVVSYISQANTADPDSNGLLDSYHTASLRLAKAAGETAQAERAYAAHPDASTHVALENAQAQQAAEKLRAQAIAANYQASARSTTTTELVSVLAGAAVATSDHSSKVELYAFTGLLAGMVIGCAGAIIFDRRRLRRAPR
jgi:capsular polysaccharide biosynthesis protein